MSLLEAKIISMATLGLVSIFLGVMPIPIVAKFGLSSQDMSWTTNTILSGILCFGGGVLMGTGFLHLLPEVHEGFQHYQQTHNIDTDLPIGIVVICAGFFLVYLIEEVVHFISDRHAHNQTDISLHRIVGIRSCPVSRSDSQQVVAADGCVESSICQLDCNSKEFCHQISSQELPSATASSSPACYGTFRHVVPEVAAHPVSGSNQYGRH